MIEKCKNIEYIHIIQQQKRYKKDIAWFDSRQPHQQKTLEVLYLQGFRGFTFSRKFGLGIIWALLSFFL
jgi:hypothetical protein|nr:MAG TPA: hypothetical protein [Caudoviricetes sp.]